MKTKTTHTPGPWESYKDESRGGWWSVASVRRPADNISGSIGGQCIASRMAERNARLIAAAPEMLEALKAGHACTFKRVGNCAACAAIAKAEGC